MWTATNSENFIPINQSEWDKMINSQLLIALELHSQDDGNVKI